jgi:hypothetical protein
VHFTFWPFTSHDGEVIVCHVRREALCCYRGLAVDGGTPPETDGLSNRDVAHKLGLTEHTVSNYLFRIYEKLGISSRVELVLYALKQRQG